MRKEGTGKDGKNNKSITEKKQEEERESGKEKQGKVWIRSVKIEKK